MVSFLTTVFVFMELGAGNLLKCVSTSMLDWLRAIKHTVPHNLRPCCLVIVHIVRKRW